MTGRLTLHGLAHCCSIIYCRGNVLILLNFISIKSSSQTENTPWQLIMNGQSLIVAFKQINLESVDVPTTISVFITASIYCEKWTILFNIIHQCPLAMK